MEFEVIQEFAKRVYRADWYYNYSDDYGAYESGRLQCAKVREDMKNQTWNDKDYEILVSEFFNITTSRFKDGVIPDSFRESWMQRINSLTGRE